MKNFFKIAKDVALDLIYPRHCTICKRVLTGYMDISLCPKCIGKTYTPQVVRDDRFYFDEAIAMVKYEGSAKESMISYKFKSIRYHAKTYAHIVSKAATERPYLKDAIMCAVPILRSRDRDYSQTALIAKELSDIWQSRYLPDLLYRTRTVRQLSKMKLYERKFFIRGSIDVNPIYDIWDKEVLVIDDIFTSGTTANECARVLKMYGASKVYILCPNYD